jgi:hypothetical protein
MIRYETAVAFGIYLTQLESAKRVIGLKKITGASTSKKSKHRSCFPNGPALLLRFDFEIMPAF